MLDPRGHGTVIGQGSFSGRDFFSPTTGNVGVSQPATQLGGPKDFFGPSNYGGEPSVFPGYGGQQPPAESNTKEQSLFPRIGGYYPQVTPETLREGASEARPGVPHYQSDDSWLSNQTPPTPGALRDAMGTERVPNPGASDPANPFGYTPAPWGNPGTNAWGAAPGPAAPPPAPAALPAAPRASGPVGPRMQRTAGSGGYYGA